MSKQSLAAKWIIGGVLVAGLLAAVWWLAPRPVVLDEKGYDVALALYRVCNQRDQEGVEEVEGHLVSLRDSQSTTSESLDALTPIIAGAKSGNWQQAMKLCREILVDQAKEG